MKKSLIAYAAALACAAIIAGRARTYDVAFTYRMGAGFAGDVNRTHPASILPHLQDVTSPVLRFGDGSLWATASNSMRAFTAADASDSVAVVMAGVLVRPYPFQAATAAGNYGQQLLTDATLAPATGVQDFLEDGRIMVQVRGTAPGSLTINSDVYVFCSADETGHKLGGFETAAITGKTVKVSNAKYRGPADANGITELQINAVAG
jgi:hypothetical protein